MKKDYYVYITTNTVNGKSYVGQHKYNPKRKYLGSGIILKEAIKRYGANNFTHEVIEWCTKENVDDREKYWIEYFRSIGKAEYNIADGGHGFLGEYVSCKSGKSNKGKTPWNKGKKDCYSKETIEQMSQSRLGRKISDETKSKMSETHRGFRHSEKSKQLMSMSKIGHEVSDETKEKIRNKKMGTVMPYESSIKKSLGNVHCIETDAVYDFASQAARETGISVSNILRCCHGSRKTAGGLHWEFCA